MSNKDVANKAQENLDLFKRRYDSLIQVKEKYEEDYLAFLTKALEEAKLNGAVRCLKDGRTGVLRIESNRMLAENLDKEHIKTAPYHIKFYVKNAESEVAILLHTEITRVLELYEPADNDNERIYKMSLEASFHGESWYRLYCCGKSAEIYSLKRTYLEEVYICPYCGKKVTTRSYIQGKVIQ